MAGDGLRVVHAGAAEEPSLQDYLALGAGAIEALPLDSSSNAVASLAAHLKNVDIILTGSNAEAGVGSGLLPYALARALARPVVANVLEARVQKRGMRAGTSKSASSCRRGNGGGSVVLCRL